MALNETDIRTALMDCYDPEIPVNIVDLGLIYKIVLSDDAEAPGGPKQRLDLDVTMTSPGCPSHVQILEQVRNRLAGVQGLSDINVNLVWEPSWGPERLSPAARKTLGID